MTNAEFQEIVLTAVVAAVRSVPKIGKIHSSRKYSGSEQQFINNHGETNLSSQKIEIKTGIVEYLGFEDTDRGCDECPIYLLVYRIHHFHGFVETRPDGSNSTTDFTATCLDLRDLFLDRDVLGIANSEVQPVTVENRARVSDDTGYTEAYGHSIDHLLKVFVAPDCSG